jgi:hypothetical protein
MPPELAQACRICKRAKEWRPSRRLLPTENADNGKSRMDRRKVVVRREEKLKWKIEADQDFPRINTDQTSDETFSF